MSIIKKEIEKELTNFEKHAMFREDIETALVITEKGEVYKCYGTDNMVYPNVDLNVSLDNDKQNNKGYRQRSDIFYKSF